MGGGWLLIAMRPRLPHQHTCSDYVHAVPLEAFPVDIYHSNIIAKVISGPREVVVD